MAVNKQISFWQLVITKAIVLSHNVAIHPSRYLAICTQWQLNKMLPMFEINVGGLFTFAVELEEYTALLLQPN